MSISGILDNLAADVVLILLIAFLGWLWVVITRRRALQQFFGVVQTKRIVIYLSNLRVRTFGAVGISGREMSYQGSAVASGEMRAAGRIKELFSFFIPALSEPPDFLKRLLIADVSATVLVSPLTEADLESEAPFIALGSSAYSIASQQIEGISPHARFRFGVLRRADVDDDVYEVRPTSLSTNAEPIITPSGGTASYSASALGRSRDLPESSSPTSAILIEGLSPLRDPLHAFVLRDFEEGSRRPFFYVAGLSEHATEGAANYLVSEWKRLYGKYSSAAPFLVVLKISSDTNRKWTAIFEKTF